MAKALTGSKEPVAPDGPTNIDVGLPFEMLEDRGGMCAI